MIDFNKLAAAETYYSKHGFQRVEVPWTVTERISNITKPPGAKDFKLVHEDGKVLVASAEQSFLYQYAKGFLPLGRFQATTPCFRHEPFDSLHTKYFIKTELIDTKDTSVANLMDIANTALKFFQTYLPEAELVELEKDKAYDVVYKGVELGSYGIRQCDFLQWIFGTACAEPRLTLTMKKFRI
jgi:hypothetical protein